MYKGEYLYLITCNKGSLGYPECLGVSRPVPGHFSSRRTSRHLLARGQYNCASIQLRLIISSAVFRDSDPGRHKLDLGLGNPSWSLEPESNYDRRFFTSDFFH
jgi:hypothetical protein